MFLESNHLEDQIRDERILSRQCLREADTVLVMEVTCKLFRAVSTD
jgi:hypothetical protein